MVKKNNEIGAIASWGPLFRVSFDLKINKLGSNWGSILIFKANDGDCCSVGDRIPMIMVNNNGHIAIASAVSGNGNYYFYHKVQLNKWYKIVIEQKTIHGKVNWSYLVILTEPKVCLSKFFFP